MTGTSAKAITFTEQNFDVEFPTGWQTITPPPEGLLTAMRSPGRSKAIALNATELPASELAAGIESALAGAKKIYIQRGMPTDPEQSLTVHGVAFRYFVGHPTPTNCSAIYAGVAGHELYTMTLVTKSGDASTDPELQTILQSFHLITPAETPAALSSSSPPGVDTAYQTGRTAGYILGALLFIGLPICGLVWLVRSVSSRSKTVSTGQVPPTLRAPPPLPPQAT